MFGDNPFLTKKDSLVEAVRQAQEDGATRRLAESMTNELFGVYSRQAVVRENLADYDFALEEAYKCMKEAEKKDEKKEDKPKSDYSKMREKMVGKGKDLETTRKLVGEAEKMADKDYDRDGKIETSKKEVWGSRLRAAKASGKYKGPVDEKKMWEEEKELSPKQKKMAAVAGNPKKIDAPDLAALRAGKKMDEAKGTAAVQNLKHRDFKETRHPNKGAVTKAPVPGVSIAEEDIDEGTMTGIKVKSTASEKTKKGTTIHHADVSYKSPRMKKSEKLGSISTHHRGRWGTSDEPGLGSKEAAIDALRTGAAAKRWKERASKKQHNEETLDEAAYSAKAARAGKDIGKPGKMFSKIASKAGAKYGSEERGKKVAGAILKRIRAKHMKEDAINEAPIIPASALKPGQSLRDYLNAKQGLTRRETPVAKPSSAPTPPARPTMGSDLPTIDKGPAPGPASTPQTAAATASAKPSAPMPPSRPSGVGTSEPGADASKFVRSQLKESVQVGENKYRIV